MLSLTTFLTRTDCCAVANRVWCCPILALVQKLPVFGRQLHELRLRVRVLVDVRVELARQLAEATLQRGLVGSSWQAHAGVPQVRRRGPRRRPVVWQRPVVWRRWLQQGAMAGEEHQRKWHAVAVKRHCAWQPQREDDDAGRGREETFAVNTWTKWITKEERRLSLRPSLSNLKSKNPSSAGTLNFGLSVREENA